MLFIACSNTMITRRVIQPVPTNANANKKKVTDAITYVLIENGFEIKTINESFGLVTTEWREVKNSGNTTANVLGAIAVGLGGGTYTKYSRSMMLQIKTTESGYQITPKVAKISKSSNAFKSDTNQNVEYPTQDSVEGNLVGKIVEEINQLICIEDNYIWEEKQITVN